MYQPLSAHPQRFWDALKHVIGFWVLTRGSFEVAMMPAKRCAPKFRRSQKRAAKGAANGLPVSKKIPFYSGLVTCVTRNATHTSRAKNAFSHPPYFWFLRPLTFGFYTPLQNIISWVSFLKTPSVEGFWHFWLPFL